MAQDCAWRPPSRSWRSPLYLVTSLEEEVAGVWAAAAPLGMHSGKVEHHPSGAYGDPQRPYPGRAPTPFLGSPDRQQRRAVSPAGFSPARVVVAVVSWVYERYYYYCPFQVAIFKSLRSLRFKAERRAHPVWNTHSLVKSVNLLYVYEPF